jgi:hypothetical protein
MRRLINRIPIGLLGLVLLAGCSSLSDVTPMPTVDPQQEPAGDRAGHNW